MDPRAACRSWNGGTPPSPLIIKTVPPACCPPWAVSAAGWLRLPGRERAGQAWHHQSQVRCSRGSPQPALIRLGSPAVHGVQGPGSGRSGQRPSCVAGSGWIWLGDSCLSGPSKGKHWAWEPEPSVRGAWGALGPRGTLPTPTPPRSGPRTGPRVGGHCGARAWGLDSPGPQKAQTGFHPRQWTVLTSSCPSTGSWCVVGTRRGSPGYHLPS